MYLLVHADREYLRAPGEELQTDLGVLTVPTDAEPGDTVETHLGTTFTIQELRGPDLFDHLDRTGAPMMPRDIGLLIGHTGAASGDRVLDAGTGTGILAVYLGRLGASVRTYEQDPEFAAQAEDNMTVAGVAERVNVIHRDATDAVEDMVTEIAADDLEPFDLFTLDTADAPTLVQSAPDLLAFGGFLAAYSPFVERSRDIVEAARETGLSEIRTFETIQRRMRFDDRGSRPDTAGVGHTGYLTFARKTS